MKIGHAASYRAFDAGFIPKELGDLDKLDTLRLKKNNLTGKAATRLRMVVGVQLSCEKNFERLSILPLFSTWGSEQIDGLVWTSGLASTQVSDLRIE